MRKVASTGAAAAIILIAATLGQAAGQQLSISNYRLISEQRASRTEWYYTYRVDLSNNGPARSAVTAMVSGRVPTVQVVPGQGTVHFAPVPAGSVVTSVDTFTVLVDRSVPFEFSQLAWSFDGPVANAGPSQTATIGSTARLNGSGSSNPSGVGSLTYNWTFVSRPPGTGARISDSTAVMASFVVDVPGTYVVSLTVSNGVGSDVALTTVSTTNSPPVANAGPSRTVALLSPVVLNGSGSSDVDGDPLTYAWQLISIPADSSAVLAGANTVSPSFFADKKGAYIARLVVNDGKVNSVPSTVTITTANTPPVANAGGNQIVPVGGLVQLNGAGSTDVDGDPLSYAWTLVTVPAGSSAALSSATAVNPTFTADRPGTYVAQLIVNDGVVNGTPALATITTSAVQAPTANAGPNQTVVHGTTVTLSGSGTDPQNLPLTLMWSLITKPAGSQASLSGTTIPNPRFLADLPGTYVAQLFVNNGYLNSAASTVTITTTNSAPVANAGADQTVIPGVTVTLNGTGSRDADNDPLTYAWSFASKPAGSTAALIGGDTATPRFVADLTGVYIAQLIVRDRFTSSSPATVMITANPLTITLSPSPLNLFNSPATLTVTLGAPAGVGGQVVRLAVLDTAIASVPTEVTVPAGATGANVVVTPGTPGSTILTASAPSYRPGTVTINVQVPAITLSLSAGTVGLTRSIPGTVTLNAPAPAGGTAITLSSTPAGLVSFQPATVSIPAGGVTGSFQVTGVAEGSTTVQASAAGYLSSAAPLSVGRLGSLVVESNVSVPVGQNVPIQITLTSAAPVGGVTVTLQSGDTSKLTIAPGTIVIPQGAMSPATPPRVTGVGVGTAIVSASAPGFTGDSRIVTVVSMGVIQVPANLSVEPTRSVAFPITLSAPASAGGVLVNLVSSDPSKATVAPSSVTIPAGQTAPATQPRVTGVLYGGTTIGASAPGYVPGSGAIRVGAVLGFNPANSSIPIGTTQNVTVTLSAPAPAGGLKVDLSSNNASVAQVPLTTTIAQGATSIAVGVTAVGAGSATISAGSTAPNITGATTTVSVVSQGGIVAPATLDVDLGQTVILPINLPVAAPAGGVVLSLLVADGSTASTSVATVTIPAGQTQPAQPPQVRGLKPGSTNLTVSGPGYSPATINVRVKATITFTPSTVTISGDEGNLTLTLSGPAPAGGLSVNLSSTNTNVATVPPTATFAASATTVNIPVTVAGPGTTTVRATAANLADATAQITVQAPADILLPADLTLSPGQNAVFRVALARPAQNSVFISLSSTNAGVVSFTPSSVFINAGQTEPASQPRIDALATGQVTVTASAAGLNTATTIVKVGYGLSFSPSTIQVTRGGVQNASLVLSSPAPAGGLLIALSSANTTIVTLPANITINANATSVNVPLTGVAVGSTTIKATLAGSPDATANVNVVNPGTINTPANLNVPLNQTVPFPISLSPAAPAGGVTVTLTSLNTSRATIAPGTVFIAAGATAPAAQPQVTGVNTGPVTITAAAPGYTTASQLIQVSTTMSWVEPNVTINQGATYLMLLRLATSAPWGDGIKVSLTSTNTAVATVQSEITFYPDGSDITTLVIPVRGVSPGTAQIKAVALNVPEVVANVTVAGPLTISTVALPDGLVGVSYAQSVVAAGGIAPYTWTLVSGVLPADLTFNAATGQISGIPKSAVNNTPLAFRVTDSSNPVQTANKNLTLTIKQPVAASIAATSGTPQSTKISTAFGAPLVATVKDANGNPVPNVTVTFAAPAGTGPSGTFAGGANTAITNASGVATSATFTANDKAGPEYTVTASVAGVATPAQFRLTNTPGNAASITATGGAAQTAEILKAFGLPLSATVKDSGGNPVPGVTVTFVPPVSGASGTFAGNVNTAVTNASGVASSAVFTANGTVGSYTVNATVAGVSPSASFSLTNKAGAPATIAATGGTPQTAAVNTTFAAPLAATVKDAGGNPVSSVTVTFTAAPSSGASGSFAGGANTAVTNAAGIAISAAFTANGIAGSHTVNASVAGVTATAQFELTNTNGSPASIVATGGTPQSAPINTAFANRLVATVKDSGGNAVPNVTVTFVAPASGASGTFTGGVNTAVTNTSGVATSAIFRSNGVAGEYNVSATAPGASSAALFALTNTPGPPASITATGGTPQSAAVNTQFAARLSATVKDAGGNGVANVTVTFAAPASGASGTFAGGVTTAVTNASGIATSAFFTANSTTGTYNVSATAAGLTPATFALTNTAGPAASIEAISGTPQSAVVNAVFGQPLSARVKDADNNPVPGVTVTFSAPASGASGSFSNGINTAITNASGIATSASIRANLTAGAYTVTAKPPGSVTPAGFALTNLAGPATSVAATAGSGQSARVGTAYVNPLTATVKDAAGNPVAGVTVTFALPTSGASGSFAGSNVVVTNAGGIAVSPILTANNSAGAFAVTASVDGLSPATFSLTNTPGPAATIAVSSGSSQTAAINSNFALPLAAIVRDAQGNAIAGATVTFAAPATGASGLFTGGINTATTNAAGIATSVVFQANGVAGEYQVSASVAGVPAAALFAMTNRSGPAASIQMTSGSPQSTRVGTAFANRLVATVRDVGGNPVSGATVVFTVPGSGASGTFASGANTAATNAAGVATSAVFTANTVSGSYNVTAGVTGVTTPATFNLTNEPGPPASIAVSSGAGQSTVVNTAFGARLAALVRDANNNPVANVVVSFDPPPSGASALFAGGVNTATTNPSGIATSAVLSANSVSGSYAVVATATGLAAAANFGLTNVAGPPAALAVVSGTPQSAQINTEYQNPLVVSVKDAFNNPVPNRVVSFNAPATGASVTFANDNTTAVTNALGIATSAKLTANLLSGMFVVTATVQGVTPVNFNLLNTDGPSGGTVVVSSATVGKGLQAILTVTIPQNAPPGGRDVTLTSANPGKVLLAGRPNDPGSNTLTVKVPEGLNQLGGIYAQALDSTGTAQVNASSAGYLPGSSVITLTPAGFVISGPNGLGVSSFSVSQGVNNTPITVQSARLTPAGAFAEVQTVRGGNPVMVDLSSSTSSVGTIQPLAVQIGGGDSSATASFNAIAAGSTTLTAAVPLGFTLPTGGANSVTANVLPSGLIVPNLTVGQNLQTGAQIRLNGTAPAGGMPLTITSNDPSKVLLSKTPGGAGAATIEVTVEEFRNISPEFFVQGLVKNTTATYWASAPSFGQATGTVTLSPSGFVLYTPFGLGAPFTSTTGSANQDLTIYSALLDASLNFVDYQPVRGGFSVNVGISSSNTTVGTITNSPVTFAANAGSAATQFDPLSAGQTVISLTTPPGFSTPALLGSANATVIAPNILISDLTVGKNLQQIGTVLLGQAAPTGGLALTLTSQSAFLKLASTPTGVGAASIVITIPAGQATASFYAHGLSDSGTASYSASAAGYNPRTATVQFAPSGIVIAGPFGFGFPLLTTLGAGPQPMTVSVAYLDPVTKQPIDRQPLIGNVSVSVTLTNSVPSVGTVPTPVVISGGSHTTTTQFTPLSVGQTNIGVTQPAGYTLPDRYTVVLTRVD